MGKQKGDLGHRNKKPSGKNELRIESHYGVINITGFNHNPETICIDFVSAMFFKKTEDFTFDNVMEKINEIFHLTASILVASNIHHLNENIAPKELRKDILIIPGELDDERGGGVYQLNKMKKGKGVIYKFGIYIHTKNAIKPNSVQIKFFDNQEEESGDVKSIRDFCYALLNSPILIYSDKFTSKKFVRGSI